MIKYSLHAPTDLHEAKEIDAGYFIRIEEGVFKGLEFSFRDLIQKGEDENGNLQISYDNDVWYCPPIDPELTVKDFRVVIEDILNQVMNEVADNIITEEEKDDILESSHEGPEFEQHEILGDEL